MGPLPLPLLLLAWGAVAAAAAAGTLQACALLNSLCAPSVPPHLCS